MAITRRSFFSKLAVTASVAALRPAHALSFAQATAQGGNEPAGPVVLSRNENAYGPSEKVLAALVEASSKGNRYPHADYEVLVSNIARLHQVAPDQVVLGCGSTEVLRSAAETFLGPGKSLVQASPTFPLPARLAESVGAEVISIPLNAAYEHDLGRMLARCSASTGLVYICNPNNPTGTLTPRRDIETFIGKLYPRTIVLIDEAYHHFVGATAAYASFIDHPFDSERVIVTRTFSKIHALAGMRVGYMIAPREIAARLVARRLSFGISVVSAQAAAAALDDSDYVRLAARRNANDRQEFMNQVNARMMRALDSHTNFVMLDPHRPVEEVFEHLRKNDILVAPPFPEMNKRIRVSLGTPSEMRQFWHVWDQMPAQKMAM
jgi:histidinol-phosphate aminotransferase